MPVLRALVTLNPSAEPEDRYVNTWHFKPNLITGDRVVAQTSFNTALNAFYQAIDANLGVILSGVTPEVRYYDLSEPKIRVPFATTTLTALVTSAGNLPAELALCLSYNAAYESGSEPRRRRGRIYLGPFHGSANDTTLARPTAATITSLAAAAQTFIDASQASADYTWVVYSRADDTTETGVWSTGRAVVRSFIDNAWDIQRRRGLNSGTRAVQT